MNIDFHEFSNGEAPALEFIESLSRETRVRIAEKIDKYVQYGFQYLMRGQIMKKLDTDLYEIIILRDYRFLGTIIQGNLYLVSGFRKKTQKTPRNQITYALQKIKEIQLTQTL